MAERYAVSTGVWNDVARWDGGTTLPGAGDDVYANGYTVTVDISPTVLSVRTTAGSVAVAGGGFTLNNGVTLTCTGAGAVAGSTTCVTYWGAGGNSATFVGAVTGSATTSSRYGAQNSSTGTLNVTGDVTGGNGATRIGVDNASYGTVNITGNVSGGSGTGSSAYGARNAAGGTLNVVGDVTGGTGTNGATYGVNNSGTLAVTGNVSGGGGTGAATYGVVTISGAFTTVTGNLIPSSTTAAVSVSNGGTFYLNGNVLSHSSGRNPVAGTGLFVIHPSNTQTIALRTWNGSSVDAERVLSTDTGGGGSGYSRGRVVNQ